MAVQNVHTGIRKTVDAQRLRRKQAAYAQKRSRLGFPHTGKCMRKNRTQRAQHISLTPNLVLKRQPISLCIYITNQHTQKHQKAISSYHHQAKPSSTFSTIYRSHTLSIRARRTATSPFIPPPKPPVDLRKSSSYMLHTLPIPISSALCSISSRFVYFVRCYHYLVCFTHYAIPSCLLLCAATSISSALCTATSMSSAFSQYATS